MTNTPSPYDLDALGDDPMYRGNPQYKELYSTHRLVCRQRDGLQARVAALEAENAKLREACRAALAYTRYGPFPEFADKEWDRVAVQHMIKDALAHEQEVKRER